jgi:hypothetical protein
VLPDPDLTEPGLESLADALRRNEAAVDTELAVLPQFQRAPRLTGPLPNPGYGATNRPSWDRHRGLLLVARLDGPDVQVAGVWWTRQSRRSRTDCGAGRTWICAA